jgi:hypothetical protein
MVIKTLVHLWKHISGIIKQSKFVKKMVHYKQWEEAGINYISDLIKNDKSVIPFESLVNLGLNKTEWFKWRGIINSINNRNIKTAITNILMVQNIELKKVNS